MSTIIFKLLLGFTHVIRLALGGQAKSKHGISGRVNYLS